MAESLLKKARTPWLPRGRRVHAPRRSAPPSLHGPVTAPARRRKGPPPWALRMMRRRSLRRVATFGLALIGLALIVGVSGVRVAREDIGHVGVVRNGGPIDTRTIRQILMPGQGLTYI